MNILGIDYGLKRVGTAIAINNTVVPLETFINDDNLITNLINIINIKNIGTIVIGQPLLLSGQKGSSTQFVNTFIKKLKTHCTDIPIKLYDERFTSKIASQKLSYINTKKQKGKIDQISAVNILESYLCLKS